MYDLFVARRRRDYRYGASARRVRGLRRRRRELKPLLRGAAALWAAKRDREEDPRHSDKYELPNRGSDADALAEARDARVGRLCAAPAA